MTADYDRGRWIFLDTETTGKNEGAGDACIGHRIIEIGAIEVIDRKFTGKSYQVFMNPERPVDEGAFKVHGISDEMLKDKPKFAELAQEFIDFVKGSKLIIHNAKFDVGFLDQEFRFADIKQEGSENFLTVEQLCEVEDSIRTARTLLPGHTRYNLDFLCKILNVDTSERTLHGALLDAKLLGMMYLSLTGGQNKLDFQNAMAAVSSSGDEQDGISKISDAAGLVVIRATAEELAEHEKKLASLSKKCHPNWTEYYFEE